MSKMASAQSLTFSIASFVTALFPLELGADKFIDHTAIFAHRIGVPQTIVALLTAGGEWEELAVIISALRNGRSSLALGNVIGSAIANILGAFSLGILFKETENSEFDSSSKLYSLILLGLTTLICPAVYFHGRIAWLAVGIVLVTAFILYAVVVAGAISRGILAAPRDSDSDSDSISDSGSSRDSAVANMPEATSSTTLLPTNTPRPHRSQHTLWYHASYILFGLLALILAGFVLAESATVITDSTGLSDLVFGVVILSIATTLPEKFVAVMSGSRGHTGILVANTVGSNIFLLSLCLGIVMINAMEALDENDIRLRELLVLWGSTLTLTTTMWLQGRWRRYSAVAMIVGYVRFIVVEFTVPHSELHSRK